MNLLWFVGPGSGKEVHDMGDIRFWDEGSLLRVPRLEPQPGRVIARRRADQANPNI